jgi:hypothetical protein
MCVLYVINFALNNKAQPTEIQYYVGQSFAFLFDCLRTCVDAARHQSFSEDSVQNFFSMSYFRQWRRPTWDVRLTIGRIPISTSTRIIFVRQLRLNTLDLMSHIKRTSG